jgi:sialate O-acetylesterase
VHTKLMRVVPYPISGFLYYQGEEDVTHPHWYYALLTTLIHHWRTLFMDPNLPFLFVQLPMFRMSYEADDYRWAMLRQAQAQARDACRNVEMAVMLDGGEMDNVHPTDKRTVGERLARLALRHIYGQPLDANSPRALFGYSEGETFVVALDAPVTCVDEPDLFEVAGADGQYYAARANLAGQTLRLQASQVGIPQHVRYAWVNYGVVNVFGKNGLPLAPFLL